MDMFPSQRLRRQCTWQTSNRIHRSSPDRRIFNDRRFTIQVLAFPIPFFTLVSPQAVLSRSAAMVHISFSAICLLLSANQALAGWARTDGCQTISCQDGQGVSFPNDNQFDNFCNNVLRKCRNGGRGKHQQCSTSVGGSFCVNFNPNNGVSKAVNCPNNFAQCKTGVRVLMGCGNGMSVSRSLRVGPAVGPNAGQYAGNLIAVGSCLPGGPGGKRDVALEGVYVCTLSLPSTPPSRSFGRS